MSGCGDDQYNGLVTKNGIAAAAWPFLSWCRGPDTVLRAAYSRTMETPFNENLLLSSATGAGGLAQNIFGAQSRPHPAGRRATSSTAGFQQKIARFLIFDGDYFWKYTHNAYDFDVLFNTPITFPIAWHNSKIDGLTGRLSSINYHGLQAYLTFGHSRARYFPPESRRADLPGNRVCARCFPDRSRSGVSADRQLPLSAREGRGVGRFHLAIRQRSGRHRSADRGVRSGPHAQSASRYRFVLQRRVCDRRQPSASLRRRGCVNAGDASRGRRRQQRSQPRPGEGAQRFRSRFRHGQSVSYGERPTRWRCASR